MNEVSVASLAKDLLDKAEVDHRLMLNFQSIFIEVRTNSRELLKELAEYFKEFQGKKRHPDIIIYAIEGETLKAGLEYKVKKPDPGKKRIKEEYRDLKDGRIVRKVLTGMTFIFGNGINIGTGPCLKNSNQIVNFINNRYIEYMLKMGCLLFHSAGVILDGNGVLLSGFSGAGKSTLALHTLGRGPHFLSNDRAMVRKEKGKLMMYGVPKLPRVNPGTLLTNEDLVDIVPEDDRKRFLELSGDELWDLEHKYDVFIDEVYGKDRFVLGSRMIGLVILNWDRKEYDFGIRKVDIENRMDLLPAFMKSPGLFFLVNDRDDGYDFSEEAYLGLLKDHPVYEITGGVDFEKAVDSILDILKEGKVMEKAS